MSLLNESLAIFRRTPLTSAATLLLIVAASAGQVVSLGSLYPIVQTLLSERDASQTGDTVFARALLAIGIAPTLGHLLCLFVIVGIGYSVLNWSADAFQGRQLQKFEIAIRAELFASAVRSDWTYGKTLQHGTFINAITREATHYQHVVKYALYTFSSFLQFAALLAYALYLNWQITLFGLSLFGFGSLVLIPVIRKVNELGHESSHLAAHMSNRLLMAMRSLKTVKALSLESYLVRSLQPSFEENAANYYHQGMLASGQYAIMEVVAFVAVSSMLYVGLTSLGSPKAELLVVLMILFRALPQVRLALDHYQRARGYLPSVGVVRDQLNAANSAMDRREGVKIGRDWNALEFREVSFRYGTDAILDKLSLKIRRGEVLAIMGTSGSGKTTFLDLLLGLLQPELGTLAVDELPLCDIDLESWHAQIAYLGQEPFAFAGTLRENLLWGNETRFSDSELVSAIRAARLEHFGNGTVTLDKDIAENASNLSGGEKQRLALARLFLRRPTLLILDEPTTGLDVATERDIMESIFNHFHDTTFVIVTHREELARRAAHILRLTPDPAAVEPNRRS